MRIVNTIPNIYINQRNRVAQKPLTQKQPSQVRFSGISELLDSLYYSDDNTKYNAYLRALREENFKRAFDILSNYNITNRLWSGAACPSETKIIRQLSDKNNRDDMYDYRADLLHNWGLISAPEAGASFTPDIVRVLNYDSSFLVEIFKGQLSAEDEKVILKGLKAIQQVPEEPIYLSYSLEQREKDLAKTQELSRVYRYNASLAGNLVAKYSPQNRSVHAQILKEVLTLMDLNGRMYKYSDKFENLNLVELITMSGKPWLYSALKGSKYARELKGKDYYPDENKENAPLAYNLAVMSWQSDKGLIDKFFNNITPLIEAGAEVDQKDPDGNTALMYAIKANHEEAVKLLLEHKADPNITNAAGKSCFALAHGKENILKLLLPHTKKQTILDAPPVTFESGEESIVGVDKLYYNLKNGFNMFYDMGTQDEINKLVKEPNTVKNLAQMLKGLCTSPENSTNIASALLRQNYIFRNPPAQSQFVKDLLQKVFDKSPEELVKGDPVLEDFVDQFIPKKKGAKSGGGFDEVAGMEDIKDQLFEDLIEPIRIYSQDLLNGVAEEDLPAVPNGTLFFGPPGSGKTYIAKKVAEEVGIPIIETSYAQLSDAKVGETVKRMDKVFNEAAQQAPCFVLIDELDGLVPSREGISSEYHYVHENVNHLLNVIEGLGQKNVFLLGTTNCFKNLDKAIIRDGRFDNLIEVPAPSAGTREKVLRYYIEKLKAGKTPKVSNRVINSIVSQTEGLGNASMKRIAAMASQKANAKKVPIDDTILEAAFQSYKRNMNARAQLMNLPDGV